MMTHGFTMTINGGMDAEDKMDGAATHAAENGFVMQN